MSTFSDLQKEHYALLAIESSRQEFTEQDKQRVIQFIENLKQGGRSVFDAQERDQMRAFLRHWVITLSQIAKDLGYQVADLEPYAGPPVRDRRIVVFSIALPILALLVGLSLVGAILWGANSQSAQTATAQALSLVDSSQGTRTALAATAVWMTGDDDRDGLMNQQELEYNTNPNNRDTDGDGINDGDEIAKELDPNNPDTDGDGIPDAMDIDPASQPTEEGPIPTQLVTSSSTPAPQGPVVTLLQPGNGSDVANAVQFSGMYANLNPTWTIHLFVQSEAEANRFFLVPGSFTIPEGATRGEWGISVPLNSVFDLAKPDRYIVTPVVSLSPEILVQVEAEALKGILKIPDSMIRFDSSSIILYRKALQAIQGPHMVYSRRNQEQGQYDLVLATVDGKTVVREYGFPLHSEINPDISRDGTQIVYVRRQQVTPGKFDYSLWIHNIAEDTRFQIVSGEGKHLFEHPHWSPDGANIAYVQRTARESGPPEWMIMVYNLNSRQVTPLLRVLQDGRYFDWLDENTIVCNALYHTTPTIDTLGFGTLDIRDPSKLNLLYDSDLHDIQPAVSPDGKFIAFIGYFDPIGFHDVFLVNLETKKRTRLTETRSGPDASEQNPTWHPDGGSIFFESFCETDFCIWKVDVNSLERHRITQGNFVELCPTLADMDLYIFATQN